ncbi:hypothetical protein AB0L57_20400, partial [Nocardia sp. NPDC052254]|uniref:hypothetical protein n=1 Tax=Nocardia sp. NPDC052254 TaxID=3155681 RepID=UPI00342C0086
WQLDPRIAYLTGDSVPAGVRGFRILDLRDPDPGRPVGTRLRRGQAETDEEAESSLAVEFSLRSTP